MGQKIKQEFQLNSNTGKPFLFDISYIKNTKKKPLIIFVHGFKGFKDWGFFNLMSNWFTEQGFVFLKMNFSFNGTTPDSPLDFVDLNAFGKNNFSKELLDIDSLLNHLLSNPTSIDFTELNLDNITLLGHSKGGATTLIKAFEDNRITKAATLASVLDIKTRYAEQNIDVWKKEGVLYIYNNRTKQNMPIYYQLAEDILINETRFNPSIILSQIQKPIFLIHPIQDETVPIQELQIAKKANNPFLEIAEINGNHTFDGTHPYTPSSLPKSALTAFQLIKKFIYNDTSRNN